MTNTATGNSDKLKGSIRDGSSLHGVCATRSSAYDGAKTKAKLGLNHALIISSIPIIVSTRKFLLSALSWYVPKKKMPIAQGSPLSHVEL
jgi:hypothetical protein